MAWAAPRGEARTGKSGGAARQAQAAALKSTTSAAANAMGTKLGGASAGARPPAPRAKTAPRPAAKAQPGLRVVRLVDEQDDDVGVASLVGSYAEKGINHGCKFYERRAESNSTDLPVFVYYWDERDGPEFSGWWFGDQVGGTQVWSHAACAEKEPPTVGWQLPWDGPVRNDLLRVERQAPGAGTTPGAPQLSGAPQRGKASAGKGAAAAAAASSAAAAAAAAAAAEAEKADEGEQGPQDEDDLDTRVEALAAECTEACAGAVELVVAAEAAAEAGDDNEAEAPAREAQDILKASQAALASELKHLGQAMTQARAAGNAAALPRISKLSQRLRVLAGRITSAIARSNGVLTTVAKHAETARKLAEQQNQAELAEERDAQLLQDAMLQAEDLVGQAEDAVETVAIMAAPLEDDELQDGHLMMGDVEESAAKASELIAAATKEINARFQDSKRYRPEARKAANEQFEALRARIVEAQKRLLPLRKLRHDYQQRALTKKVVVEITMQLGNAELEVEKAHIMITSASDTQMSEEEIKAAEELLSPASSGIAAALASLAQKSKGAHEMLKKELAGIETRAKASKAKLDSVRAVLSRQREGLIGQAMVNQTEELVGRVDDALLASSEAEMPFLRGVEVLPSDEAMSAARACDIAAEKLDDAVAKARSFLQAKITEAKTKYSKETAKTLLERLFSLQERMTGYAKKAEAFRQETTQRKTQALLSEVFELVSAAEEEAEKLGEVVASIQGGDLDLEELSADELTAACERSNAAERVASSRCQEARMAMSAKQRDAKARDPTFNAEINKLNTRLSAANQAVGKHKLQIAMASRLVQSKQILQVEGDKIAAIEDEATQAEIMATPVGDERANDEVIKKLEAKVGSAQALLTPAVKSISIQQSSAGVPSLKAALSKLVARAAKIKDRLDAVKQIIRAQKEKASAQVIVEEAEKKVAALDTSLEKVTAAELPFLKGIEVLPSEEAAALLKDSEAACTSATKALDVARTFIAEQKIEARRFSKAVATPTEDQLNRLAEKITSGTQRVNQFKKETEGRRRASQIQEAADLLDAAEIEVKKTTAEVMKPLDDEDSNEAAKVLCDQVNLLDRSAQAKMKTAKDSLQARKQDVRGPSAQKELLDKLQDRFGKLEAELAESKKTATTRELNFVARKIKKEASQMVSELEAQYEKLVAQADPLLGSGKGAELLAGEKVIMLGQALVDVMKDKGMTQEELFGSKAEEGLDRAAFELLMAKLPELSGRSELSFPKEQQDEIFATLDADGDGKIGEHELGRFFMERYLCVRSIAVTDGYDITNSKTLGKLEISQVLETQGPPRGSEELGVSRLECKVLDTGLQGWVTTKGNQGTTYLERCTPHEALCKAIEKHLEMTLSGAKKTLSYIREKLKELSACDQAPLREVCKELTKLRPQALSAQQRTEEVRRNFKEANKDFEKRSEGEKLARQDVFDKKTADATLEALRSKGDSMGNAMQVVENACEPLTSTGPKLTTLPRPLAVLDAAREAVAKAKVAADSVRSASKELPAAITKATRGPLLEARTASSSLVAKADSMEKKCKSLLDSAEKSLSKITEASFGVVAAALRADAQRRGLDLGGLFDSLAGGEKSEQLTKDAFCAGVEALTGEELPEDHSRLVCAQISEATDGAIARRSFLHAIQQYYGCVKPIAMTTTFEISKGKTARMLEREELLEVLEGPMSDESVGVMRIRARALMDGMTGWVSVHGNQGTPYLKVSKKPFLCAAAEIDMDADVRPSAVSTPLRKLRLDEVLEVLEGPRKDKLEDAQRIKVKASKDGASGWLTIKDSDGCVHAKKETNFYVCTSAIAVTDHRDIRNCKVLRKLTKNETFRVVEGPYVEEDAGVTRVRGISMKDGTEGWVTLKGNAGTVYAEASTKHYVTLTEIPMQNRCAPSASATVVRKLAEGEAVELLDGPKEEKFETVTRTKVQAVIDGAVGWITATASSTKEWAPTYKCVTGTVIQDAKPVKSAKALRRIDAGEVVTLLEGPVAEPDLSVLRIRARAPKDGIDGWITVRGNQGTVFLVSVPESKRPEAK